MTDKTISLPDASDALAAAGTKLLVQIIQERKAAPGVVLEVSSDVEALIADMGPVIDKVSAVGPEIASNPLGVVEAFVVEGFEAGKQIVAALAPPAPAPVAPPAA
jgi:hypothetical protein